RRPSSVGLLDVRLACNVSIVADDDAAPAKGDGIEVGQKSGVTSLPTPYARQTHHEQALADAGVLLFYALYDDQGLTTVAYAVAGSWVDVYVVFASRGTLVL